MRPILLSLSLATTAHAGALDFQPGRELTSSIGKPEEIIPADLDKDGDLDLVVRTGLKQSILLFENKGGGKLAKSFVWEPISGERIHGIADFDTDGIPDILISRPMPEDAVSLVILYGIGFGEYGLPEHDLIQTSLGTFPEHTFRAVVADVNASGKPDVILGNHAFIDPGRDQEPLVVLSHAEFVYNPGPHRWADLDADGLPEALLSQNYSIFFAGNDGGGKFSRMFPMGWGPSSGIQNVRVEDIHHFKDNRLPGGHGFIAVLTEINTHNQRLSLLGYGDDGMKEFHSLPLGHGDATRVRAFAGFTSTSGKSLLASIFDQTDFSDDHIASTRASVIEIGHAFRGDKPVLVTKKRLEFLGGAHPLAYADLNGDGIDDLVVSTWRDSDTMGGQLRYHVGKRRGGFAAKPVNITGPASDDSATHMADYDGDGDKDLIGRGISLTNSTTEILLWENLGGGNFRRRTLMSGLYDTQIVSVADRNGDSRPDLLLSGLAWKKKKAEGECKLLLSLSGEKGKRTQLTLYRAAAYHAFDQVRAGDWDGDGIEDLLVWEYAPNDLPRLIRWLKGGPEHRFAPPVALGQGYGEVLQDIDGDGDLDLVPSRRQLYTPGQNGWQENTGASTPLIFHSFPAITGAPEIQHLISAEADLDRDGRNDLIGVRQTQNGIYCRPVILSSALSLTPEQEFPSGEPWFHDLNNDGANDLILVGRPIPGFASSTIVALEKNAIGTYHPPVELHGIGLANWGSVLAGDLDGDNRSDIVASNLWINPRIEWFKAK